MFAEDYIPAYCPHRNSIERLWGIMHANVTHNQSRPTRDFAVAIMAFVTKEFPARWSGFCDQVSDNFRVINP